MASIASQITSLTIVHSAVFSDADQRKHQSSASLALVRGIHRGPGNSPHKWPVTRKMFPFDDVIRLDQTLKNTFLVLAKTFVISILENALAVCTLASFEQDLNRVICDITWSLTRCRNRVLLLPPRKPFATGKIVWQIRLIECYHCDSGNLPITKKPPVCRPP